MTGERKLTGGKVLAITIGAFVVIFGANMSLLYAALGSFPGLEVKNSYVASQSFDRDMAAQKALGWQSDVTVEAGALRVSLTDKMGAPLRLQNLNAKLGRATHNQEDRVVKLRWTGTGYVGEGPQTGGAWIVWLDAIADDGTAFRQRHNLYLRNAG